MTVKHDPDAILVAWLEEGPQVLPEVTRPRSWCPFEPPVNRGFRTGCRGGLRT